MKGWSNSEIPSQSTHCPEKRLLAAVLQRAVTDFLQGDGDLALGARAWILGEEDGDAPLTFNFICEALDIDADTFRKMIFVQAENAATANAGSGLEQIAV